VNAALEPKNAEFVTAQTSSRADRGRRHGVEPMNGMTIDMDTLRDWLDQGRPVTVLDVRPSDQHAEWAIPGSVHVDAYEALQANDPGALLGVRLPQDRPVVTVCGMGRTSAIAAQQLRDRGYEVFTLIGGMKAWSLAWNSARVNLDGGLVRVIQLRRTGKGCLSYLIGSQGQAAVIDASVAPEVYVELASGAGWKIADVLDTHVHADHLSRSRQLSKLCGATLWLPAQRRVNYRFAPVRDGETIQVGAAQLAPLHTPGHTPESTCYLLDGKLLFTGDTLFLAGVGRPDLEATAYGARLRAEMLYDSLQKILALSNETLVLPGHISHPAPFDGVPLYARLAEVRQQVQSLRLPVNDFVSWILGRIPPTPPNHHEIVQLNEQGLWPEGDPTDLEAGANRCAVS
jgi:glyoxylase-like metal-dependent hydrolase (beta-lactamase superfamily II)/rhodanese-related sulfurtransferase